MTYGTLISTTTVGSGGAANILFSSIPAIYTDLFVVVSGRITSAVADDHLYVAPNADGSNIYSWRFVWGSGTGVGTSSSSPSTAFVAWNSLPGASATANTFGVVGVHISNYLSSTAKAILSDAITENNAAAAANVVTAGLWNSTAAISSVYLAPASGSFAQYTTASLYGIK
jgi:hypothetical protein